jgi:cytidine deaminase
MSEVADLKNGAIGPELFIGLVGPLGTDLELVQECFAEALAKVDYKTKLIKFTEHLPTFQDILSDPLREDFVDERIRSYIRGGNALCEKLDDKAALAELSMDTIRKFRKPKEGSENGSSLELEAAFQTAFILRSFKRPAEVALYRKVYSSSFWLVAAYAPRESRVQWLAQKISKSRSDSQWEKFRGVAEELINLDAEESGEEYGQGVRKIYQKADVFLDLRNRTSLEKSINRFIEILFGHPFITPSIEESGMFHAFGASLRSSSPGRQVGAAIADGDGEIIAIGTNEVPKAGGISPNRYIELFTMTERKDSMSGVLKKWSAKSAKLKIFSLLPYMISEKIILEIIVEKIGKISKNLDTINVEKG